MFVSHKLKEKRKEVAKTLTKFASCKTFHADAAFFLALEPEGRPDLHRNFERPDLHDQRS